MTDPETRLTEVEMALAHQERLAEELSDVVRAQAARIDRLERRIAEVAERMAAAEAQATGARPEPPPPHW
jgi:SlyX protein